MEEQEVSLEQRIMKASIEMFITRGIKTVSMDEVAKSVGISKRTLYEVFSSKDELLYRCLDMMMAERSRLFGKLMGSAESIIDLAYGMVEDCLKYSKIVSPAFWDDLSRVNYRSLNTCLDKNREDYRQAVSRLLDKGKELGLIREDVDSYLFSQLITTHNNGTIRQLINSGRWTFPYLLLNLSGMFLRGIATVKGIELIDNRLGELKRKLEEDEALIDKK